MFKRILVPLDGSSFGEAALRPAVALAKRSGGQLRLLTVAEPEPGRRALGDRAEPTEWRDLYLQRIAHGRASINGQVSVRVRSGTASAEILSEAEKWDADLIVMSTHGRGGVSRLWLGSVADQCLRHTRVPLLLVRPQPSEIRTGDGTFAPGRIVVPLDGGQMAETALSEACALAGAFGATLELVRVTRGSGLPASSREVGEGRADAREYLEEVARRLRCQGETVTVVTITDPRPAQAILEQAGGDLVVMATHTRSTPERTLLGSVADKVVRGTLGPVLLVPPPQAKYGRIEELILHSLDDDPPASGEVFPFPRATSWAV
jgi:nucleotide-binding universal stress UspA family protein